MKSERHTTPELSKDTQRRLGERLRTTYVDTLSQLPQRLMILSRKFIGTDNEIMPSELPEVPGPLETNILEPETTRIAQAALDEGWAVVQRISDKDITREDLAKRLIALIWSGERSPSRLVIQAFRTLHRKRP